MELCQFEKEIRRNFNVAIALIGIIPLMVFVYILAVKAGTIEMLAGDIGYYMLLTMTVIMLGILVGRRMIWGIIAKLLELNMQIKNLQDEILKKNKLAAISETVLTLRHEINNPLCVMSGNIELLQNELNVDNIPMAIRERCRTIKTHCDRIAEATNKMSRLSNPVSIRLNNDKSIIDLKKSS